MQELFRLKTTLHSPFDQWITLFIADAPTLVDWSTFKELINEYAISHAHELPNYFSSALSYYAERICSSHVSEIIIYTAPQ